MTIAGVVIDSSERISSRGDGSKFYVVTLDDGTATFDFLIFGANAETYERLVYEREKKS